MESAVPDVRRDAEYVFSAMVGMARCAVPARVVAGGTNFRATLAFEGVAPLHAARTSQRDVPTTLNTYSAFRRRAGSTRLSELNGEWNLLCQTVRRDAEQSDRDG